MLSMGDKIRRRMDALGINQTQLAEMSGVSQGIISQLLSGKQKSVSPDNLHRLSEALKVPVVYWLTDSVREYIASRLANRGKGDLADWAEWTPSGRIRWVIEDIDACWGPENGIDALAEISKISRASLEVMLAGRLPLTQHVLHAVSDLTGVPSVVFTGEITAAPDGIPQRYLDVAETAYTLGIDPDYAVEVLILFSRRPSVPQADTSSSNRTKGPGQ